MKMMRADHKFKTSVCLALAAVTIAGCAPARQTRLERIDESLTRTVKYLMAKQSDDGAWRSETYGCFRDGPTLTPYIMSCLLFLPQGSDRMRTSFRKGVRYVMDMVDEDGNIRAGEHGLNFSGKLRVVQLIPVGLKDCLL